MKKSQNSRNHGFSYYFCLMIEGSGFGSGTQTPMPNFIEFLVQERHHLEFQSILESMRKREKEEKVERARRQAEQRRLEDDLSAAATVW